LSNLSDLNKDLEDRAAKAENTLLRLFENIKQEKHDHEEVKKKLST
jgi:hypothetical protein